MLHIEKTPSPPPAVASVAVAAIAPPARSVLSLIRSIIPAAPADEAGGASSTRDIWIDNGRMYLEVRVAADVDLDTRFPAICLATGDSIFIHGWQIIDHGDLGVAGGDA